MTFEAPPAGRRRGVVARAFRRVLLALLREEVDEMRRGLAAHQGALDGLTADLASQRSELTVLAQGAVSQLAQLQHGQQELSAAVEALRGDLGQRFEAAQRARLELQTHLETITGQLAAEVAELRSAFLATRGEFEEVRDGRVPALEATAAGLDRELVTIQQALEELSALRVARLEEVAAEMAATQQALQQALESLHALRLPRLEHDAREMAAALEQVQAAVEELGTVRVAQLELDGSRLAAHLHEVQEALEALRRQAVSVLETDLRHLVAATQAVQGEMERLRDERVPAAMRDLAGLQAAYDDLQGEVLAIRDLQLPRVQEVLTRLQRGVSELQQLGEELRDHRLPALAGRYDALISRLHEQGEATAGLLDRLLAGEGLRIDTPPAVERELPEALRRAHLAFVDEFRGGREETLERVGEHVSRLLEHSPVLDLGCGRGELLEALQRAGVKALGVDADPAMVEACRRRGLEVVQGDALEILAAQPPGSLGAVTALHLFEHLPAGTWAGIVQAAVAALRPGGVVLVECPNPEALRVGADLFWIDPTHRTPVHRQALAFVLRALGLEVVENTLLHPFPPEQMLAAPELPAELRGVAMRLDALLSAPRDFLLVARKPSLPPG